MLHPFVPRRPLRAPVNALVTLLILIVGSTGPAGAVDRPLEGFGASTPGGTGGAPYLVTSLADAGPGTIRDAVSGSHRWISFGVAGTIRLQTTLNVRGSFLTIDGSSAPAPGITLTAATPSFTGPIFEMDGDDGAHDVIVRHLRIGDDPDTAVGDNIRIEDAAYNLVVDHCSLRRCGDGSLDISDGAHDVTVQWCILAECVKNQLIRTNIYNLSLHHNLYIHGMERNPQVQEDAGLVDMVNNVIYGWGGNYGARFRSGAIANLVRNCFLVGPGSDPSDAVIISPDAGHVYSFGNQIPAASDDTGNWPTRLVAPPVTEMDPSLVLLAVAAEAGAFPRDLDDQEYVADLPVTTTVNGGPLSVGDSAPEVEVAPVPIRTADGTTIRFDLAASLEIGISIYDVFGRQVRVLPSGRYSAGRHELAWDARDDDRVPVPAGFYFVRVACGDASTLRKLVVTE